MLLGIDIGGTKTALALYNEEFELITSEVFITPSLAPENELKSFFIQCVKLLTSQNDIKISNISGIGIGVPAAVNKEGKLLFCPNIPELCEIDFVELFNGEFNCKVCVGNDADLAALAEFSLGAGRGYSYGAYLTVSTGIGCGLILDGKLFRGSHGFAGEAGHIKIDINSDAKCGCGNCGCAEALGSGSAITNLYKKAVKSGLNGKLTGEINGEMLYNAYKEADAAAVAVLKAITNAVGTLVFNINTLLDLEAVVIGGGLTAFGEDFFDGVRAAFNKNTKSGLDIIPAGLDSLRGALGAAILLTI